MRAMVVGRIGGPEVLESKFMPEPQPRAGEVLVRVEAAGVNFADTMMSQGLYPGAPRPPFIPGLEVAGTVENTRQRVMAFCNGGGYAERATVHKESVMPCPRAWSASEAAAFPVNYFTAYFAYEMARLLEGEVRGKRVLIHAAGGGVGTAAVQIGKLLGLETYGTASSGEKLAQLKTLGLTHGINYKSTDYEEAIKEMTKGSGVDAVFEMLGGEHTAKSTRSLASRGSVISYGTATGKAPQFDFMALLSRNASVHGLWLTPMLRDAAAVKRAWSKLSEWIEKDGLRPVVGHALPLERAGDAHRMLLERRNYGKIVLTL